MLFRTAVTSGAILLGLATTGALAGPGWEPVPLEQHVQPSTRDTTIGGADGGFPAVPTPGTFRVHVSRVTIPLDDGASVSGLLREPVSAVSGRPGVVFVHGAGTGKARDAFTEAAAALASAGIVTLVPDKHLAHYSLRHRDYVRMAADYDRSVEFLRTVPGVDPERVGLYAESEGCWIAPVAMAADERLAFQVWVSAPVVPPRQQAAYAMDNYLRDVDVPAGVFRAIPRAVGMRLPGGGFEYADFEIGPWLDRQTEPVLMAYGARDPSMPMEQAVRRTLTETPAGSEGAVTVRFYPGANHGINVAREPDPADVVPHGEDLHLHPGFARDVATWVHALPQAATARPHIAGARPEQQYLASPVPRPQWYGDGDAIMAVVLGATAAVLIGTGVLTGAALRRRTGSSDPATAADDGRWAASHSRVLSPGLAGPLAVLTGSVVMTAGGLVWYLLSVARIARDYGHDALVVQGGWIGVRACGLVAVVAAAVLLLRCRQASWRVVTPRSTESCVKPRTGRGSDDDGRAGRLTTVAFWLQVTGTTVLGLVLAYWGVYQLGV